MVTPRTRRLVQNAEVVYDLRVPQPAKIRDVDAVVTAVLARATRPQSTLHGERHWRCVGWTAALLAREVPAADGEVAFLFALLHDSQRLNDDYDPQHGPRAAAL